MVVAIPFWLLRNGGLQRLVELGCVESMSTVDCPRGGMEPQLIQQYSDAQSANTAATALAIAGGTLIGAGLTALVIYAATPRAERTHSTRVRVECNASTCGVVF